MARSINRGQPAPKRAATPHKQKVGKPASQGAQGVQRAEGARGAEGAQGAQGAEETIAGFIRTLERLDAATARSTAGPTQRKAIQRVPEGK